MYAKYISNTVCCGYDNREFIFPKYAQNTVFEICHWSCVVQQ